ncbi:MAG: segregation/condensation protein A [Firmicutes bacterium]|jgi:segregation and condensation protein A|nr:segregation/condensation protein A [Bacillota bacterium]
MKVETPVFSGPLDLLLNLIEQKQIDICEVSISEIADDYLAEISNMEWPDIDQVSEFLVIAATLLYIKARALLPPDEAVSESVEIEEELDPRAEFVARLVEYKRFRDAARALREQEERAGRTYARPRVPLPVCPRRGNPLAGIEVDMLLQAFRNVLESLPDEFTEAPKDEIPVAAQMVAVLSALTRKGRVGLLEFLGPRGTRTALIATLLAVLELARRGRVFVSQPTPFGEIWVFPATGGDTVEPETGTSSD